jgi:UDPglucose 6-dehydrogenase
MKLRKHIVSLLVLFYGFSLCAHQITIIGCGYVGLTMAGVFCRGGHKVVCVDVDKEKIKQLEQRQLQHIYEPKLQELLFDPSNDISFVSDLSQAIDSEIFYICVGTPTDAAGNCDCSYVHEAFRQIVEHCACRGSDKIVCVKSTVSPKTIRSLHNYLIQNNIHTIHLLFNPEFMREGSAIQDIYYHNPVVIGGESSYAIGVIESLYKNILPGNPNVIKTNYESAELIKYAWNAFSAMRIAFVNELAVLCRLVQADVMSVIQGFGLCDNVLPTCKLKPGPGFGGSCFPKDTRGFAKTLELHGIFSSLVHQAIKSNEDHIQGLVNDMFALLGAVDTKTTVAVLGLSFKANTNDIRCAASIDIIKALQSRGVSIRAYDPKAMPNMKQLFPDVTYCDSPYDAVRDADGVIVLTEWQELKELDLYKVAQLCRKKKLFDTRNLYSTQLLDDCGFTYLNMGAL